MSPTTDDADSSSKKYPLRLQMPADDADVEAFLAAQGARLQSQAIVMLIRMWVNEFGPTNVLEQTMGSITMTDLKRRSGVGHQAPAPADSNTGIASQPEPEATTPPAPAARRASAKPTPSQTVASGLSDDFEDLFRK